MNSGVSLLKMKSKYRARAFMKYLGNKHEKSACSILLSTLHNIQGAWIKLSRTLILNYGQRQYQSKIWCTKYERYTPLLPIISLVSIMASSYEDL